MGMLMHHTWLEQQNAEVKVKPSKDPVPEEEEQETPVNEPEPAKRPGRRKVSK